MKKYPFIIQNEIISFLSWVRGAQKFNPFFINQIFQTNKLDRFFFQDSRQLVRKYLVLHAIAQFTSSN